MNSQQLLRMQQACHIRVKQLQSDGVIPASVTAYDYAAELVGRPIASLKQLKDWEILALRDRLEGKPNKILLAIFDAARAAGIADVNAWIKSLAENSKHFGWLRGHMAANLPLGKQWRLLQLLKTRTRPPGTAGQAGSGTQGNARPDMRQELHQEIES